MITLSRGLVFTSKPRDNVFDISIKKISYDKKITLNLRSISDDRAAG
jgi:hypothetical protein